MKRVILIVAILLSTATLHAQKDNAAFYKHEVRASVGDASMTTFFCTHIYCDDSWERTNSVDLYVNTSLSYFYRPVKWLWVGGNFIYCIGPSIHYKWREYDVNGRFMDFSKSKIKHCAIIAPEIRFSYRNNQKTVLYSSLLYGIGTENGYSTRHYKYPITNYAYFHLTYFGFNSYFGKNNNMFLGGDFGLGCKGLINIHGGYSF